MLTRRQFVKASCAIGVGALSCGGEPAKEQQPPLTGPPFPRSILRGSRAEVDGVLSVIEGQLPADMEGHALIIGGVPYGDGTPLFTADGMIYRLSFRTGEVQLRTRLVRTDDFLVDEAAGNSPELGFVNRGLVRTSPAFGARNFANTALVPFMDGRLLATYDAGRPMEIDPVTLEVVTPVGKLDTWRPFLPPLTPGLGFFPVNMSTAHPFYDPNDGRVYLVNYATPIEGLSVQPFLRVLVWDGKAEPTHTTIVDETGKELLLEQSCHQLQVTRSHVILSDGAFYLEAEQIIGRDITLPQRPTSVLYILRKDALSPGGKAVARRVEIPIESVHLIAEYDDSGDRITLLLPQHGSGDASEWVRAGDVLYPSMEGVDPQLIGMLPCAADRPILGRYTIDATTGVVQEQHTSQLDDDRLWQVGLWTQDERGQPGPLGTRFFATLGFLPQMLTKRIVDVYRDHPYRKVPIAQLPKAPLPGLLLRIDCGASPMRIVDSFALPPGHLPMSPTFVPGKNGGRDEGYLAVLTVGPETDEVWIFAAGDLRRGPLCRLGHPQLDIGFSLHTTWMGKLKSTRPDGYRVRRSEDYGERIKRLSPAAQALARRVLTI